MILKEELKTNIELALASNRECKTGILYSQRIFAAPRDGKPELLVLLETQCVSDMWGHVAYIHQKWTSSIVSIKAYFGGSSDKELIDDFWTNIDERAGFELPLVQGPDVLYSTSFEEAVENLIRMIKQYYCDPGDYADSYAVYEVYGMTPLVGDINLPNIRCHAVRGPGSHVRKI